MMVKLKKFVILAIFLVVKLLHSILKPFKRISNFLICSIRYSLWRARLGALGENSKIYPSVVIHSPENVRIGDNVAIAEFVHIWGGEE
ncbi:MAG TPA: hypothetical protein ENG87_01525 [Candidatus Pacearchaeota archaeon]|nr:hypothetical protein [Candidatus Pacearchaeota archaeon]